MFNFTALLGAQSDSSASQSLLELDGGVKLLVDVGWDETFDAEKLQALEKHVSTLSVVLLTHATVEHIGAYAHCCKHMPAFSKIPVYATTPVINLGRTLIADLYASSPLAASVIPTSTISSSPVALAPESSPNLLFQPPTADEIASYFNHIHPLKYSQPHQPIPSPWSPSLGNLTVTAYSAGHTPGGTIWHIQHSMESIVYAADWNQGRENLLSGAAWLGSASGGAEVIEALRRPTALVCSSKGVEKTDTMPRKKRDETLVGLIRDTIAQGGKVLIPTDSSARVLELAFVLNQTWKENITGPHADTYRHAKIYMASKTSSSTVRQLQGMLEWLDESIMRDAEAAMGQQQVENQKVPTLLEWDYVKQIERQSQFDRVLRRPSPCILLASDASLEWGFSRQALESLAADSRNLVVLTETVSSSKSANPSLAAQLAQCWKERASGKTGARVVGAEGHEVSLRNYAVEALDGDENMLYQQYIARQRQLHSSLQGDNTASDPANTEIADDQASESSESEDEDEDPEHQGRALNLSAQMTQTNKRKVGLSDAELGINVLLRSKNIHDFDVRQKRGREKMFPFVAHRAKADEYGDIIKPEDYLRAEERDDVDGVDMREAAKQEAPAIGQKRKWDDAATSDPRAKGRRPNKQDPNKRTKTEESKEPRAPDDIDALIARATGEEDSDAESDYEPEDSAADGPQKIVFSTQTLALQIRIAHVDFSGRHEKRDLQMLIPLIRPRKLILISGDVSETQTLAEDCRQLLAGDGNSTDVFAPVIGEMVDASVDTNAWTLKLSRQLVKKLTWQNVKGLGVVALTGRLEAEELETDEAADQGEKKKLKLIKGEKQEEDTKMTDLAVKPSMPVLDLVTMTAAGGVGVVHHRATQPVHVGDLRLADLRNLMRESGHTAEFRGEGTLLIDNTVVVRKSTTGKIEVEAGAGGMGRPMARTRDNEGSFYAVRKLIYEGLAVVAGV
jgi:cleavage and polyadenylation specificity factor subunit 2